MGDEVGFARRKILESFGVPLEYLSSIDGASAGQVQAYAKVISSATAGGVVSTTQAKQMLRIIILGVVFEKHHEIVSELELDEAYMFLILRGYHYDYEEFVEAWKIFGIRNRDLDEVLEGLEDAKHEVSR